MIKKILWQPDTCECAIYQDVEYTDGVGEILGYGGTLKTCDVHTQYDGADLYDAILTENKGKNVTMGQIMQAVPSLLEEFIDTEGKTVSKFKADKEPKWNFDVNRKLVIDTTGTKITLQEKAQIDNLTQTIEILNEVK